MIVRKFYTLLLAIFFSAAFGLVHANESTSETLSPEQTIETAVQGLLDEFVVRRNELEQDEQKLFELVDMRAQDLFDFERISKLILGKNWKQASESQRQEFQKEFKHSLIVTYSRALFQYTGKEKMEFTGSEIIERSEHKFATVDSLVQLQEGEPVPVKYSMQLIDGQWKIYNLTVQTLNMVLNFRKAIQEQIAKEGLDETIASLRNNNAKLFSDSAQ